MHGIPDVPSRAKAFWRVKHFRTHEIYRLYQARGLSTVDANDTIATLGLNWFRLPADVLAHRLNLTYAERQYLNIRHIGATDIPKAQRTKIAAQRKVMHRKASRHANGSIPRAQYEAQSISQTKPWLVEGISRRTWYRRRGTSLTPPLATIGTGLTPHLRKQERQ